jgi:cell wall-associated NlpC family hydrolase
MHLSAEYWANLAEHPDEILKDEQEILALAAAAFADDPNMVDLAAYADELTRAEVTDIILSMSKPYTSELYYRDGGKVETANYDSYERSLNLAELADNVVVRFGMVLQRADMRSWPTEDVVFKSHETIDLDRFQENALFPADMVAVLHESSDGQWVFVQSFNYAAWVHKDSIAIGVRSEILDYKNTARFLLVTGSKVTTNFNPTAATISELQLDMGIRLPLADLEESSHNVDGQDQSASHAVRLPVRDENAELGFRTALIARSQDVQRGYLPFTRRNILEQAFKFLGERYGWGHSYNARDCTGLVAEVYKTFGIQLPRNSGQQGLSPIGHSIQFDAETSDEEKLNAVVSADVGDLLYSTGHVMLYLGTIDDMPYVIHDLSGFGWAGEDGQVRQAVLNGVSVTPLMTLHSSRDTTYFQEIYAIKQIR